MNREYRCIPTCKWLARGCPASVIPGVSVASVRDRTSGCRWRLGQQHSTLVVACRWLSWELRRGLLYCSVEREPDTSELTKMMKASRADTGNVFVGSDPTKDELPAHVLVDLPWQWRYWAVERDWSHSTWTRDIFVSAHISFVLPIQFKPVRRHAIWLQVRVKRNINDYRP